MSLVSRSPALLRAAGLGIAAPAAVAADWSLPEFCWSTWLAGLLVTWLCVLTGAVQIVATAGSWRDRIGTRIPALARLSPAVSTALTAAAAILLAGIAFRVYTLVFGFYGLFLSVFAEMEPRGLFGRDGFINSDFWTPVRYLASAFWGMAVGTLVAHGFGIVRSNPWKRMLFPLGTEIVRIHVMVILMPFLALIAWAILGDAYHLVVIVLLMAVFYLLPGPSRAIPVAAATDAGRAEHAMT